MRRVVFVFQYPLIEWLRRDLLPNCALVWIHLGFATPPIIFLARSKLFYKNFRKTGLIPCQVYIFMIRGYDNIMGPARRYTWRSLSRSSLDFFDFARAHAPATA